MTLKHIPVGARVRITEEGLGRIRTHCVSKGGHYNSSDYYKRFEPIVAGGIVGYVTHTFEPGYAVTVRFPYDGNDLYFHLYTDELEVVDGPADHSCSEGRHDD